MVKPTLEEVQTTIDRTLGIDQTRSLPDAKIIEDLGADSLDLVELIMACEERFEVQIDDNDVPGLITVQDLVNHLQKISG